MQVAQEDGRLFQTMKPGTMQAFQAVRSISAPSLSSLNSRLLPRPS